MKYRNMKKRYWTINLQLFAGDDDGGVGSGEEGLDGDDPGDDPEDDSEDDPDERKFTQQDVDEAIKKRLARERRKWNKEQQKKTKGTDGEGEAGDGSGEDDQRLKEVEERALKAETKVACLEVGVDKDAVDDVTTLAHAYMEADEDLDLEDAIEKVIKKYPHFKNHSGKSGDDADGTKGKSWGERQRGGSKKLTGVEAAFLKKNPGLKY